MSEPTNIPQSNGKTRQLLAAIVMNLLSISCGVAAGWPSPVIRQLRSPNPPIGNTPLTEDQISWITSLPSLGGLITVPFCSILVERLGRKNFGFLTGLIHIGSWLLIVFARNYLYLWASRATIGMAAAFTFFVVPLYINEIVSEEIRGILGSLLALAFNVGTLYGYVVGAYLTYHQFACACLLFSLWFVSVLGFLPETPAYLMRQNCGTQARRSLMFFRGNNEALVNQELEKLRSQSRTSKTLFKTANFSQFFNDRATRKGLIISFGLLGGQQLSGIAAVISYAEPIFHRVSFSISAETASTIIAVIQIFSSYTSTMLMDRAGRRLLTLVSCVGMTMGHLLVGLYFYLQQHHHNVSSISWLPLIALSLFVVTYCLGIGSVPIIVTSEVFRLDISSYATNLCLVYFWAVAFVAIQGFNLTMKFVGESGSFIVLACVCATTFAFTYFLVPETKGRDRQDIVDELAGGGSGRRKTGGIVRASRPV